MGQLRPCPPHWAPGHPTHPSQPCLALPGLFGTCTAELYFSSFSPMVLLLPGILRLALVEKRKSWNQPPRDLLGLSPWSWGAALGRRRSHPTQDPASLCQVNQTVHFLLVTKISVCHHLSMATVNTGVAQGSSACPGFSSAITPSVSGALPPACTSPWSAGRSFDLTKARPGSHGPVSMSPRVRPVQTQELHDSGDSGGSLRDIGPAWDSRRYSCPWQGLE